MKISTLFESLSNSFYHVTESKNLSSISQKGLVPKRGARSQKINETEDGVYLFGSLSEVEDALMNWLGDEFDEDVELAILQVQIPSREYLRKDSSSFEFIYKGIIPPSYISLVRIE